MTSKRQTSMKGKETKARERLVEHFCEIGWRCATAPPCQKVNHAFSLVSNNRMWSCYTAVNNVWLLLTADVYGCKIDDIKLALWLGVSEKIWDVLAAAVLIRRMVERRLRRRRVVGSNQQTHFLLRYIVSRLRKKNTSYTNRTTATD